MKGSAKSGVWKMISTAATGSAAVVRVVATVIFMCVEMKMLEKTV